MTAYSPGASVTSGNAYVTPTVKASPSRSSTPAPEFHGPNAREEKYVGRYGGRRLWRTADRLAQWITDGCDVYAYFNNDYHGAAVLDAQWLRDRVHHALVR